MQRKEFTLAFYQKNINKLFAPKAFGIAFILSCLVVIPIMIVDNGYFLYYGDFNVQEIPFYKLAHDAILSGNYKWSSITDLGSNFIGSYSFYLLGSPFFYLTLFLPSEFVPYAMGPLLILKLSFCSLSAYIYLRRYVKNKDYAVIGGILYAFSGFSIYNIFFFHFHEAMIIFPLLLAAIDEFIATKRKGMVAIAVFAAAFINYYFFFGEVVFVGIYFVIKIVSNSINIKFKEFLFLAFECIIGLAMSALLLLPSILAIVGNDRVSSILMGWDALIYKVPQRYVHIITSFFFPPDLPARPNFTPDSSSKWASVAAFLPLFSSIFVIAYIKERKGSWIKRLFVVLCVFALIPILNSMFQAFNSNYYARWFYMFTLINILMTIYSLDNIREVNTTSAIVWTSVFTLAIALSIGFMPTQTYSNGDVQVLKYGLFNNSFRFWVYVFIAVFGIVTTVLILIFFKDRPKLFSQIICLTLCVFCVGYSEFLLFQGKNEADYKDAYVKKYALDYGDSVSLDDIKKVRSDFYSTMDNLGMYWEIPSIQAFHSIVPSSLMDFYNEVGVERNVASRPSTDYYGLRSLLSVKYLFTTDNNSFLNSNNETIMPGYKLINSENGINEFENENYIPMGFTYDTFICEEEFKNLSNDVQHLALLKSMVLTQSQMKKYKNITNYKDGMYLGLSFDPNNPLDEENPEYENFESLTTEYCYTYDDFVQDCNDRNIHTCSSFNYTNDGFEAQITNNGDENLLFFSIPYDDGWNAYINGEQVPIEKVNIGFMAVKIDKQKTSNIKFIYNTPGLNLGLIISGCSLFVFIIYLLVFKGFKAKNKYVRKYKIKLTK